jgi:hypothetical protein
VWGMTGNQIAWRIVAGIFGLLILAIVFGWI